MFDSPEPVILSWSGGKDSALALQALQANGTYTVSSLLTAITDTYDRISIHGVRVELLNAQIQRLGIPLQTVVIPPRYPNDLYEKEVGKVLITFKAHGISRCAFGDLFLEGIREYRDEMHVALGMETAYPLWGEDTRALAERFIADGFRAVLVCVDPKQLDPSFCGREFDEAFLEDLPEGVDPCGERGEFHTFVYDGPIFPTPISVTCGDIVERDEFYYCDLLPG